MWEHFVGQELDESEVGRRVKDLWRGKEVASRWVFDSGSQLATVEGSESWEFQRKSV
jgi:hypothetical protein